MLEAVQANNQDDRIEQFKSYVTEALKGAEKMCSLETARARKAKEHVGQLNSTVSELREKLESRETEAEELRATISEAITSGENVDADIQKRSTLIAECQVIKDLIEDMLKTKIPAAQGTATMTDKLLKDALLSEMNKIRDEFQENEINQAAREIALMAKTFLGCVNECLREYPDILFERVPEVYLPDLHSL